MSKPISQLSHAANPLYEQEQVGVANFIIGHVWH